MLADKGREFNRVMLGGKIHGEVETSTIRFEQQGEELHTAHERVGSEDPRCPPRFNRTTLHETVIFFLTDHGLYRITAHYYVYIHTISHIRCQLSSMGGEDWLMLKVRTPPEASAKKNGTARYCLTT